MENKQTQESAKSPGSELNKPLSTNQPSEAAKSQGGSQSKSNQPTGSAAQTSRYPETSQNPGQNAGRQAEAEWNEMKDRGAEMVDQAKQTVTDAYNRTSQSLNEGYEQAISYGRQHPGQAAAVCFGVGVGVGLWLANSVNTRSRASRIVPPVMNALSDIAVQLFR